MHKIIQVDDTLFAKDDNCGYRQISSDTISGSFKEILKSFGAKRMIYFDHQGDLTYADEKGLDMPKRSEEKEFLRNFFVKY